MNKTLARFASVAAVSTVAGAGMVAAAAPAQAYESVWDKVAFCESTNRWDINTGNGFYGGLQFTISTWREFGGTQFASRADYATKLEQITVAKRVLAVQGPGAWPKCSIYAGLTKSNGGATYDWSTPVVSANTVAVKAVTYTAPVRTATASTPRTYTVQSGDTLFKIAQKVGISDWHKLYELNKSQISNPDMIYVGQHFVLS